MFDVGSLVSSLAGIGTKIGTSIPGLKKVKRNDRASAEVRKAQNAVAGAAVGGSQTGHGASRGLALRAGLRSAAELVGKASAAGAGAARADENAYRQEKDQRNARLADFGGDLAKGLGDVAGSVIQPKEGMSEELASQPEMLTDSTGLGGGAGIADGPGAAAVAQEQQQLIDQSAEELDDFRAKADAVGTEDPGGPRAAFQVDPTTKHIESAPPSVQPELEQQLMDRFHMKELALAEGERLGLAMEEMLPRITRKLQLRPGQSFKNPMGAISPIYDDEVDGEQ